MTKLTIDANKITMEAFKPILVKESDIELRRF